MEKQTISLIIKSKCLIVVVLFSSNFFFDMHARWNIYPNFSPMILETFLIFLRHDFILDIIIIISYIHDTHTYNVQNNAPHHPMFFTPPSFLSSSVFDSSQIVQAEGIRYLCTMNYERFVIYYSHIETCHVYSLAQPYNKLWV